MRYTRSLRNPQQEEAHGIYDLPNSPRLRLIVENVKAGLIQNDDLFDQIYPEWAQALSRIHWTPVRVARRAAQLLSEGRTDTRILDVGSGVGKFCLVGALSTPALFFGIEQRPHFVELSRRLARHYHIPRTTFIHANFTEIDWQAFNGIYLFNPFQENLFLSPVIDSTVTIHPSLYKRYTESVERKLRDLPAGTRIVTYWGFGGDFPEHYRLMLREDRFRGTLEYRLKVR